MNFKLIATPDPANSGLVQVLLNRGIPREELNHYINTTDEDIYSPILLGESKLKEAINVIKIALTNNLKMLVVIDSDCDGYTSSALFLNWFYSYFPSYVSNNVEYLLHNSKSHGLSDCLNIAMNYDIIICPDSSSNDYKEHEKLAEAGKKVIVLDHHEADMISPNAVIINNQLSEYPNKFLSGVGITWQFCKYFDSLLNSNHADKYLDLVALGNTADMMSLKSFETKHLINKGFLPENIKNPFIYYMWQKNEFKLGDHVSSWGAAFYIAPLVNAVVRSGTMEEQRLVFNSMLEFKAFEEIPSTKRGHKEGEMETIVAAAMRVCTNVKNHQTKAEKEGLELVEKQIEDNHLLEHKVILISVEPGQINKNIAGLVANRLMGKYQRPVCVLTHANGSYSGSARGCDTVGVTNFKDICEDTDVVTFVAGHQGAFGLGIMEENLNKFLNRTDLILEDMPDEAVYKVDYLFNGKNINSQIILDIADMDFYWGKDIDESLVGIQGLKVTKDMVTLMSPDKTPTLKIQVTPDCSVIKFNSSQEEYDKICNDGFTEINLVGTCNKNEWMGNVSAQIMLKDFEIIDSSKYYF